MGGDTLTGVFASTTVFAESIAAAMSDTAMESGNFAWTDAMVAASLSEAALIRRSA